MSIKLFSELNFNPAVIQSVPHGIIFWFLVAFLLIQLRDLLKIEGEKTVKARTVSKNEQIYKEIAGFLLWGILLVLFLVGFK